MNKVLMAACLLGAAACSRSSSGTEASEVRITKGAGGVGFLPLLVMEKYGLVEKHAKAAGIENLQVRWIGIGGPAAVNDALLSGSADFIAAGPPGFITLWDKTVGSTGIKGVAAMTALPMYLNTRAPSVKSLDDVTEKDKIAVTAIKVSIPAIVMQMYASEKYGVPQAGRFDKFTVSMTHPDGVVALLAGSGAVDAHFTSPPFHQRERKDPRVHTIMKSDDVLGGSTTFAMLSTTTKFRAANPKIYSAVLSALGEADQMIVADKTAAAKLLLTPDSDKGEGGFSLDQLVDVLNDPDIKFTTTPRNTLKYAEFMHSIGSIQNRPASWKDLFFPEIHGAPGS